MVGLVSVLYWSRLIITRAVCHLAVDFWNDRWLRNVRQLRSDVMYIHRWQWRNFDSYLCQLVFAAILWVNLLEMFATVILLKCALLGKSDRSDIFITQRIEFYLNNTINFRPLTPQIMPYYTHKVAILSWPQILWRHFILCIDNCLFCVCGWNHCRVLNHWCQQNHNSEIGVSLCFCRSSKAYILSEVPVFREPSVLWCSWLGVRKSIRPVKNWVMRCWCGYLSGARCRLFAYGPADATASQTPTISCVI